MLILFEKHPGDISVNLVHETINIVRWEGVRTLCGWVCTCAAVRKRNVIKQ
jgi:hypothetical protein